MRGAYGALFVAVAALIVCCKADPHRDQDVHGNEQRPKRYDLSGHKNRIQHPVFEGDGSSRSSYDVSLLKMLDYLSRPKYQNRFPLYPMETSFYYGGMGDDYAKRNFDEIDRSNLDTFVSKRNFDEIDRSSMPFPYATKRFYHMHGNYLDLDTPVNTYMRTLGRSRRIQRFINRTNSSMGMKDTRWNNDKRNLPEYPMDEIDLSLIPIGGKRSINPSLNLH